MPQSRSWSAAMSRSSTDVNLASAGPQLGVPGRIIAPAGADTEYATTLTNTSSDTFEDCTGEIAIGGIDPAKVKVTQRDFDGQGNDLTVSFEDHDGQAVGTYPDSGGFPVPGGLQGQTTNVLELNADVDPGDYWVTSTIRTKDGKTLATARYTYTVTAGEDTPPPDPDPEAPAS